MKRVTACHGVGRKPEDGKRLHIIELRLLSPVSRVPCFLLPNEGLTPAMDMSPTDVGYKFRSPAARQIPIPHASAWGISYMPQACISCTAPAVLSYRCVSSGTSCLPKELKFANIGILKALETFSQGTEVYCAMSIGCTAAYAAVTGRRCAAQ